MRSAHYPREDLELLPAERPDTAGMPQRGGVPTNLADAGAAWTLPPAPPSTDASLTCLPTPEGCRAAPFHHLYLKGHKQPSAPRRHDLSGSAPASLDSCRMEGGVRTPWRPWAWSSRRCPLETCAPTQCPLSPAPRPQVVVQGTFQEVGAQHCLSSSTWLLPRVQRQSAPDVGDQITCQ